MKTSIHSSVVSTLIALAFSISCASGGWTEVYVGLGEYQPAIGRGRNDGMTRVYSSYWFYDKAIEYTWQGDSWFKTSIDSSRYGSPIVVGAGRQDGLNRVYCSGSEYTYAASSWNYSKTFGASGNDMKLLPGRNDGINRLYAAGESGFMHEYTWVPATTSYADLALPSAPSNLNRLAFGNVRNDGINRLCGVTSAGELCEWTYSSGWTLDTTSFGIGQMFDLAIGSPRGDGLNRIYLACADGLIYETTWNGSAWVPVAIGFGTQEMKAVTIGVTRNDGKTRVLVGNQDGRVYELTFQNGTWIQDLVVQSAGNVQGLTIGAGRGDGVNRIYASKGGSLKEYTYTPSTSAPFSAQLLPGGIIEWSSTPGSVYDVEWSSDLTTWRSDWTSLTGIPATGATTQQPIPRFFRVKKRTE